MTRSSTASEGSSLLSWVTGLVAWVCWLATAAPAQIDPPTESAVEPLVVVIEVHDSIGLGTVSEIQTALRNAQSAGYRKIVLDIDTPGGLVSATKEIEALLQRVIEEDVNVVGFVRHQALSGGAYVALACDQVFMAPGSSIGAITPVVLGPGGIQQIPDDDTRRKLISGLRGGVRSLVEARGRVPREYRILAEAMVDPWMELSEVTWEDAAGVQQTAVLDPDEIAELERQQRNILNQQKIGPMPLTLTPGEAERWGFSSGTVSSIEELVRDEFLLPVESILKSEPSWPQRAVSWLESMKPFLFVLGFILLMLELKTPGFAVPGALGVLLLGAAMFSSYMVGLAEIAEILLFFAGIAFIVVEIFVMPGTLFFGLGGLVCLILGLILSQQSFFIPATDAQRDILTDNLLSILISTLFVIVGAIAMWRITPYIPIVNRVFQAPPAPATGTSTQFARAGVDPDQARQAVVGHSGVAVTDLRPAGTIEIDGEVWDAVADGTFVERGAAVRVVSVHSNRIMVEAVPGAESGEVSIGLLIFLWLLGLCLAVAEIFFPSMGVLSILSAVSFVSSIFFAYTHHSEVVGHILLVTAAIVVPALLYFAVKVLPRTRFGNVLLQKPPEHDAVTGSAADPGLARFLGQAGQALSSLRPSGTARINGERVDVITRGEMLDRDTPLVVIQIDANRVVVKRDASAAVPSDSD